MKPERIQIFPTVPTVPTAPPSDRGVYQTIPFNSFRKATNFAEFVEDMGDNRGRKVTCLANHRTYKLELLVLIDGDVGAEEAAQQISSAWTFLDEVKGIHATWSAPSQAS